MSEMERGIEAIIAQQRQDLVGYLTRVRNLPAPTRDLVFMHSEAGVASGLEAALSDRLATMARNGQTDGLEDLLGKLPAAQREAAVETLARWSVAFALAPERKNAVAVLLAASAVVGELGAETTALVASAVLSTPGELPAGALGDTVRLAQRCRPPQRRQLVARLKERDDVGKDSAARAALIASFPEFDGADQLYGMAMAMAIEQIDAGATKELLTLPESEQARLLALAEPTVQQWINAAREKAQNPPEGQEPGDTASVNGWLVPALQVVESSRTAATRFAIWLLSAENEAADAEVEERLELLAPVSDPALGRLMLTRMQTRPLANRGAWLDAIDPDGIDHDAVVALDAAAQQLWGELIAPDADPDALEGLLDRLGAFARTLASEEREFPQLVAAIDAASDAPMQDEDAAQERLRVATVARGFVARELADATHCADRFIASATSAMAVLSAGELDQLPQVRTVARQLLADWVSLASIAALQSLREAATQDPAAPLDPTKAEALLRATGSLTEQGQEASIPIEAAAVGGLGRDYGERADGALLAWLAHFSDNDQPWAVLAPMWRTEISPPVRQGFGAEAKQLSTSQHRELAEAAFQQSLDTGAPPAANWEAIALHELSGTWVVGALAKRRPGEDLERWRILLEIARQRVLTGKAKRLVASELLGPLAALGSDPALELALDNLELTDKRDGEEMLKGLQLTVDQARLVEAKVTQLGWRRSGLSRFLRNLVGDDEDS